MKRTTTLIALCTLLASLTGEARADLLISEVLFNEIGGTPTGEWIEIYNNGATSIDLTGYKIGDEETQGGTGATEGMFAFPTGALIAAGAVQIVAVDADVFLTNYGVLPTYEVTGANASVANLTLYTAWDADGTTINMSNTNDQAVLLDASDTIIDAVSWGGTFAFDPSLDPNAEADGQSWERISGLVDTDTAADWQLGSPSSPFAVAVPEPSLFTLVSSLAGVLLLRRRRAFV